MTAPLLRLLLLLLLLGGSLSAHAEAMLQLFNVTWSELIHKMPEIAEAGYTSLWLPPPAKGGSGYSVGYDVFDAFDLGDKNQRGTVATRWGTKAELQQLVLTAHQFGIRVYFDNVMNHRAFDIPGYDSNTPTNLYPALVPGDFHLQTYGQYFRNWPNISDWNNTWQIQNQPLSGLLDLANEPGAYNANFGPTLGSTFLKPYFVRQPGSNSYYMATNLPAIGGPWRPFNGTNGAPVPEDVNAYLIRAALWFLNETKCDGFRLDAVKHTPSTFFGDTSDSPNGYLGAIQTMFDFVHGYGNNVTGNGYLEPDDNRNSVFDTETPRNDAMLFGEHLGEPPSYSDYIVRGMRLLNAPLQNFLGSTLGNPSGSLSGLDGRDFVPPFSDGFSPMQSVQFAQSHDHSNTNQPLIELQNAYDFMHEGLPEIYSDGWNLSSPSSGPFPAYAMTSFLGEFNDNRLPEIAYAHNQLARGGSRGRWSDNDIVAFERYDYRDVDPSTAFSNPDATVVLFAMNDNFGNPGDIAFDDGISRTPDGFYTCTPNSNLTRPWALRVGFPPGSLLSQLASSAPGADRACPKLLVHSATTDPAQAQATATASYAPDRLLLVNATPPPGGGALELRIPSGGWVMYGYQWPEPSRASLKDAITFRQGGAYAPRITVYRHDGVNGDSNFNPIYPFKMRGSIDPNGNVIGGNNVSNLTYAIDIPVITNGPVDILLCCDASAVNILTKMDGGLDLNGQLGLGPLTGFDRRDNRPGYATDVFLGYEQAQFQFRYGPEKFAAALIARNNVTSLGAETWYYTVGGDILSVNGDGNGSSVSTQTARSVYHDPAAPNTASSGSTATQRVPLNPVPGQPVDLYVKVGYNFQTNHCFVYYSTDGSTPEGSFAIPKPGSTTLIAPATWLAHDNTDSTSDWFKATIPAQPSGTQLGYKIAVFQDNIPTIPDSDPSKLYGLTQFGIPNFNPTSATVWLHNDLNTNNTATGLAPGFHILRARCFLPRNGKSGVYNTFLQSFYYDSQLPTGVIAAPGTDGATLGLSSFQFVIRTDSNVTGVDYDIQDSDSANDDAATGHANGNGSTNVVPVFLAAAQVAPNPAFSLRYPNLPQEFRFNYYAIPSNGTATITVRLKEFTSSLFPNRFTVLTRTVDTAAPGNVLYIGAPAFDGMPLVLASNDSFQVQACFSSALTATNKDLFSLYINGVLQPRSAYTLLGPDAVPACPSLSSLLYNWTNPLPGTNIIQLNFTNQSTLSATRTGLVGFLNSPLDSDHDGMPDWMELLAGTNPYDSNSVLRITGLANGNQLAWSSIPNINYQVLATTNLSFPMLPISPGIQASDLTTFWTDPSTNTANKFYRIQVVP